MSPKGSKNVTASVRQRLLNIARETGEDFGLLLTRYANERFLYRLGLSVHADRFVVKGAWLFVLWSGEPHRTTRDIDLLGEGSPDADTVAGLFRGICDQKVEPDGLAFDTSSVAVTPMRAGEPYSGIRLKLLARLGAARIPMQVDVGFGDAVTPAPQTTEFPTLLDMPPPRLRAYPRETVVAEKLEALVDLGMANTRMKDFYDLYRLAIEFDFAGATLADAVRSTFERRKTSLPDGAPVALSGTFAGDGDKQAQWSAFLRKTRLHREEVSLPEVIEAIKGFLLPVLEAARDKLPFRMSWRPGGPWRRD